MIWALVKFWAWSLWSFLQSYFSPSDLANPVKKYGDLSGQVWLVTGGTSGVGFKVAVSLAKLNARVWITGRNPAHIEQALSRIHEIAPSAKLESFLADFADLRTVVKGAQKLLDQETQLHGIIHNAATWGLSGDVKTAQNTDIIIGVNNVAPHLLQYALNPLILHTPGSRIVWTSCFSHALTPMRGWQVDKLDRMEVLGMSNFEQYAISKALAIMQSVQWSNHHPNSGTKSVTVNPGVIINPRGIKTPAAGPRWLHWLERSPDIGALTTMFAAIDPSVPDHAYIDPTGVVGLVRPDVFESARDAVGEEAWNWLEDKIQPYIKVTI